MADPREAVQNRLLKSGRERKTRAERQAASQDKAAAARTQLDAEKAAWRARQAQNGGMTLSGEQLDMGLDENEKAIMKAQDLQQKNQESLANTLRMARDATQIADDTSAKLAAQTEQMKRMDKALDETNASLTRSNRIMRGMKSIGGSIANFFSKPEKHQSATLDVKGVRNNVKAEAALASAGEPIVTRAESEAEERERRQRIIAARQEQLNDPNLSEKDKAALREIFANQDREDDQLDEVGQMLDHLKYSAQTINNELKVQEQYVDHLDNEVDRTTARMEKANLKVKEI